MKSLRWVVLGFGVVALSACSTSVTMKADLPPDVQSNVAVNSVRVGVNPDIEPDVASRLEAAVKEQLAKRPQGSKPVTLALTVRQMDIVSGGARFFAGAFAGSNTMGVQVQVLDADNKPISEFEVDRSSNPGGYGAFYDQRQATIEAAAEGIVDTLYGGKKAK